MEGSSETTPAPTLPREMIDLLIEFSIGLQKAAIYPSGHPILDKVATGVLGRLESVLAVRPAFLLGVAPSQLILDAIATDADHPVLRALATRLHQHQIGSIRIVPGVTVEELERLMQTLGVAGSGLERPIGLEGPSVLAQWTHIRLMPLNFSSLELADGETISIEDAEALWIRLVQIALAGLAVPGSEVDDAQPATVAEAIERRDGDAEYDQTVMTFLHQVTTAINTKGARDGSAIRLRVSELVQKLGPSTLERLLHMGGDETRRQRFLQEAVSAVTADAVMDLAVAAATASEQTISTSMMRMLNKLSTHAREGMGDQAAMADVALREQVTQLMNGWTLGETDPAGYRSALDRLAARDPSVKPTDEITPVEPLRVLQMGLEMGMMGTPIWPAVDEMVARGELESLLDLLETAPGGWMTEALGRYVATPERLVDLLRRRPWPETIVARLVERLGIAAVPVFIDVLDASDDPAECERVLRQLERIGSSVARPITARLAEVRWPTLLHLITLLGAHPTWTSRYDPMAWTTHADPRVRREAVRQVLRTPQQQGNTIAWALSDTDEEIVRLALAAAMTSCSREVAAVLRVIIDDATSSLELRALALRAVAGFKSPETPTWLVGRVLKPGRFLRRATLLPTTPELVATIEGLAVHWGSHPAAVEVLTLARSSADASVRAAASSRPRGR